jgi:branched-subunit amino acid ABC-type transport system permease component
VVVVGGLGQFSGAIIAAAALGLLNSFAEFATTASIAQVIVFVAIVIFSAPCSSWPQPRYSRWSRCPAN